jgi:hypothetical protein
VKDAVDRDMLIFFEHDPAIAAARIARENGKLKLCPSK